ncbi:hypothetical protein [Microlunatus flavus]|uniref:Uncharacterized protein n=1 Tax=Microlunatus flavus TaxID=1036181 RepID=A0A1H9H0R1_9ACTN|nr:hypothetical protein [Microlunatus flavus]SEQ55935.1 hypothetical protein SAMN05421756_10482 [Microlunatus flavus]
MTRGATLRSVVLPVVSTTLVTTALAVFLVLALAGSGFGDLPGGFGGVFAGVGVSVMSAIAAARSRRRAAERLPGNLTATQREQVVATARGGPLPADPVVRAEARRLAEQWADARPGSGRVGQVVFLALALVCVVAGALTSPWWWALGGSLAGIVALGARRTARRRAHRERLRETALPPVPAEGVQRLLDVDVVDPDARSGRGLLDLRIRPPWGGGASLSATAVRVDGELVASEWGRNRYLVPPGSTTVSVWIDYLSDYGRATTTVDVPPDGQVVLHYSPPSLTFLDGRIGPSPQRSAGARGLLVGGLAFAVAALLLVVLLP